MGEMGQLGKWTVWGTVTAANDNRGFIYAHAWGSHLRAAGPPLHTHFQLQIVLRWPIKSTRCCWESHLWIWLKRVCKTLQHLLPARASQFALTWLQDLTQLQHSSPSKRRASRKLHNGFTRYSSLSLSLSLSLALFPCCIEGMRGWGRKGQGNRQNNTEEIWTCRSLFQLQHLVRKQAVFFKTEAAASCGSLNKAASSNLSPLQYLAYHVMICTFAILLCSWSTWWDSSYLCLSGR